MTSLPPEAIHEVNGVIRDVDVPGRQLTVMVDNAAVVFDVAPDCMITLHDDRVKLRLLQPMDIAQLVYSDAPEAPVAHLIRVDWWFSEAPDVFTKNAFRPAASQDTARSVG